MVTLDVLDSRLSQSQASPALIQPVDTASLALDLHTRQIWDGNQAAAASKVQGLECSEPTDSFWQTSQAAAESEVQGLERSEPTNSFWQTSQTAAVFEVQGLESSKPTNSFW